MSTTDASASASSEVEPSSSPAGNDKESKPKRRWPEPIGSIRDGFKKNPGSDEYRQLVIAQFSKAENPYDTALNLIETSPDYLQPRVNTMTLSMAKLFASWIGKENREEKFRNFLTSEVQNRAFHLATRRHTILLSTMIKAFNLLDVAEMFVDDIRGMASNGMFREAAECANALKLQRYFGLNEMLIPCILQDKVNFVEPYLADVPELQQELVEILDDLLSPDADMARFLTHYRVSGIRKDKLCLKPLQKLVSRLTKVYNIPPERTPNLVRVRNQGTLRYLLHKRYEEKTMHADNFNDMVRQGIETCPVLLNDLFQLLCFNYKDYYEAAKWAGFFQVPRAQLPQRLQRFIDQKPEALFPENGVELNEDTSHRSVKNGGFYSLPIPPSSVITVDNEDTLRQALQEIEEADIVGLDTESQPGFCQSMESVALLQIATAHRAFLLDIQTLKNVDQDLLKDAIGRIFVSARPRKLGFGFGGDMKSLAETLPFCQSEFAELTNTICISGLVKNLIQLDTNFFSEDRSNLSAVPHDGCSGFASYSQSAVFTKSTASLADLCQHFLGKPLDKSEQFSNWSRRPLRWNQMRYAALDAYCLLPLFEKLRHRAVELKIDFEGAISQSLVTGIVGPPRDKKPPSMKKIERAELLQIIQELNAGIEATDSVSQFRRPSSVRVVADKMLQGLGRHLRRCGLDCLIAENDQSRKAIIGMAMTDQRILLTSGSVVQMASSRLPSELVCAVPASLGAREQLAWFLKMMKIRVTEEDIFSRCMVCNCSEFLFIPSWLLRIIYDAVIAPKEALSLGPFNRHVAFETLRNRLSEKDGVENGSSVTNQVLSFTIEDDQWVIDVNGVKVDLLSGTILHQAKQQTAHIEIESIPAENAFEKISLFYVCSDCGKIYWDGSHTDRYVSSLRDIVESDHSDTSEKEGEV